MPRPSDGHEFLGRCTKFDLIPSADCRTLGLTELGSGWRAVPQGDMCMMNAESKPSPDQLCEVVQKVWSSLLGVEASPTHPSGAQQLNQGLTASIEFRGKWEGYLHLRTPRALASHIAVLMFRIAGREPNAIEVQDALGETALILGAHIKDILPSPSVCNPPMVREAGAGVPNCGSKRVERTCCFESCGCLFQVEIVHVDMRAV